MRESFKKIMIYRICCIRIMYHINIFIIRISIPKLIWMIISKNYCTNILKFTGRKKS